MKHCYYRAGHLPESHLGILLDRAEAEINFVKQKFDRDLKQEKQKLCQKLITERRREMLQKVIIFNVFIFIGLIMN